MSVCKPIGEPDDAHKCDRVRSPLLVFLICASFLGCRSRSPLEGTLTDKPIDLDRTALLKPGESVILARCGADEIAPIRVDKTLITAVSADNLVARVYRTGRGAYRIHLQWNRWGVPFQLYDGSIRTAEHSFGREPATGAARSPGQIQITTFADRTAITRFAGVEESRSAEKPEVRDPAGARLEFTLTYLSGRYNVGIEDGAESKVNTIFSGCELADAHLGQRLAADISRRLPSQTGDGVID